MITLAALLLAGFSSFALTEAECPALRNIRREMSVVADNIANIETTRTPNGGAYKEKIRVCEGGKCKIKRVKNFKNVYEPEHPDADENGYVKFPAYSLESQSEKMNNLVTQYEEAAKACRDGY